MATRAWHTLYADPNYRAGFAWGKGKGFTVFPSLLRLMCAVWSAGDGATAEPFQTLFSVVFFFFVLFFSVANKFSPFSCSLVYDGFHQHVGHERWRKMKDNMCITEI